MGQARWVWGAKKGPSAWCFGGFGVSCVSLVCLSLKKKRLDAFGALDGGFQRCT